MEKFQFNSDKSTPYPSDSTSAKKGKFPYRLERCSVNVSRDYLEPKYWRNKYIYLLSCAAYIIGIGNFWRFPNLCFKYSSAFFIPYFILLFSTGIPLVLVELTLGQISRKGDSSGWGFSPLFRFVVMGKVFLSAMSSVYRNVIMSWAFFYILASLLSSELPWKKCRPSWATSLCQDFVMDVDLTNCTGDIMPYANGTCYNTTNGVLFGIYNTSIAKANNITKHFPAKDYMYNVVLQVGNNTGTYGNWRPLRWNLVVCQMLVCILVFISTTCELKSSFKAVILTVTLPYVTMVVFLIETSSLDGCLEGIIFYLKADFSKLTKMNVWKDAARHIFFTYGIVEGGLMTLASYNRLHNNVVLDAFILAILDTMTSIAMGLSTFAQLGAFAKQMHASVEEVGEPDFGLAFITFPQMYIYSMSPKTWVLLFFITVICLSLGTEIGYVETMKQFAMDVFKYDSLWTCSLLCQICSLLFTMGIIFGTPRGFTIFKLMNDFYFWTSIILALLTILALTIYGSRHFCQVVEIMVGAKALPFVKWKYLRWYFIICWQVLIPMLLTVILFSTWVFHGTSIDSHPNYAITFWTLGLGIAFTMILIHASLSLLVFDVWKRPGTLKIKILNMLIPGPAFKTPKALHAIQRRNTEDDLDTTSEIGIARKTAFAHLRYSSPSVTTEKLTCTSDNSDNDSSELTSRLSVKEMFDNIMLPMQLKTKAHETPLDFDIKSAIVRRTPKRQTERKSIKQPISPSKIKPELKGKELLPRTPGIHRKSKTKYTKVSKKRTKPSPKTVELQKLEANKWKADRMNMIAKFKERRVSTMEGPIRTPGKQTTMDVTHRTTSPSKKRTSDVKHQSAKQSYKKSMPGPDRTDRLNEQLTGKLTTKPSKQTTRPVNDTKTQLKKNEKLLQSSLHVDVKCSKSTELSETFSDESQTE